METKLIKHLVISGGGINGISYLAGLDFLYDNDLLIKVEKISTASVGSIIGFLYLLGFEPIQMGDLFESFGWKDIIDPDLNIRADNFSGIIKGVKIINILTDVLKDKNLKKKLTFKELYEITEKDFYVTGVNCYTKKTEYFSHIDTPEMSVLLAIRISIAVPILFKPVVLNNAIYVDGGTLENLPIEKCLCDEETFVMSYKKEQSMGVISNITSLLQNDTVCAFPCIIYDEIGRDYVYSQTFVKCYKETEHFFDKKIL